MINPTALASAIAAIATAGTPPIHAQAASASYVNEERVLLDMDAAASAMHHHSHSRHSIHEADGNVPAGPLPRRLEAVHRALQQEIAELPGAEGAEIADFKEALLAELERLEETLEDPQLSDENAEAQFFEFCPKVPMGGTEAGPGCSSEQPTPE